MARERIRPPGTDVTGGLSVSWGNGKMVGVASGVAATPFVTPSLPRGVYIIQSSTALWWNVGHDADGGFLDTTVTSANASSPQALAQAPKRHQGVVDLAVAVDDDERIVLKAVDPAKPADVRNFKGA